MKVFVDECVNYRFMPYLHTIRGHHFEHILDTSHAGLKDHILLPQIDALYDVFLTRDTNLRFHNNLAKLQLCFVFLNSSNKLDDLTAFLPDIDTALTGIMPQDYIELV